MTTPSRMTTLHDAIGELTGELAAQPVPYVLTPAAEELLDRETGSGTEASS
jgi:hypothetical protein